MIECLDVSADVLRPDATATRAELSAAMAAYQPFVAATPLKRFEDAPLVDGRAMGAAQRRLELAKKGQRSLRDFRRDSP